MHNKKSNHIALVGIALAGALAFGGLSPALADDHASAVTSSDSLATTTAATTTEAPTTETPVTAETPDAAQEAGGGAATTGAATPAALPEHPEWTLDGIDIPSSVVAGDVTLRAKTTGDLEGATYNYVWRYGNTWKKGFWDSSVNQSKDKGNTTQTSWTFRLTRPGTYYLCIDVVSRDGVKRTAKATVRVTAPVWSCAGIGVAGGASAASDGDGYVLRAGQSAEISTKLSGDTEGCTFNYVWRRGDGWKEWDSTVRRTHEQTSETSWNFSPAKVGTYHIAIDVRDRAGVTKTYRTTVRVTDGDWSVTGVSAPTYATVGSTVSFAAKVTGQPAGATYNYVWRLGNGWREWDSTVKRTHGQTTATTGSFKPTKPGTYNLHVDVRSRYDRQLGASGVVKVWGVTGVNARLSGQKIVWRANLGIDVPASEKVTYNYVWRYENSWGAGNWGSTVKQTGSNTSATSCTLDIKSASGGREGMYTLSVDVFDKNGNKVGTKSTKVLYCPSGKTGWQNPKGFYQVSSHNVKPKKAAYGTKFAYMTPSRIAYNATRSQCVEAFVGRAYDYLGTPYMWNYACAPGVGVDCVGLVFQCAYACGMNLGEFNPYDHYATGANGWHSHDAMNLWNYGKIKRVSLGSRRRGDLIFWKGHVAVYLGNDQIIEAPYAGATVRKASLWVYGTPMGVGRMFI